jgi:hypothetical protein
MYRIDAITDSVKTAVGLLALNPNNGNDGFERPQGFDSYYDDGDEQDSRPPQFQLQKFLGSPKLNRSGGIGGATPSFAVTRDAQSLGDNRVAVLSNIKTFATALPARFLHGNAGRTRNNNSNNNEKNENENDNNASSSNSSTSNTSNSSSTSNVSSTSNTSNSPVGQVSEIIASSARSVEQNVLGQQSRLMETDDDDIATAAAAAATTTTAIAIAVVGDDDDNDDDGVGSGSDGDSGTVALVSQQTSAHIIASLQASTQLPVAACNELFTTILAAAETPAVRDVILKQAIVKQFILKHTALGAPESKGGDTGMLAFVNGVIEQNAPDDGDAERKAVIKCEPLPDEVDRGGRQDDQGNAGEPPSPINMHSKRLASIVVVLVVVAAAGVALKSLVSNDQLNRFFSSAFTLVGNAFGGK